VGKKSYLVAGLLAIVLLAGVAWYGLRSRDAPEPPIASSGGSESLDRSIEGVPYWLQNDPRWGSETIGGSDESMAAAGCTVTCAAMALAYLGHQTTPLDLCRELKARDGFTSQGYLVWDRVAALTNGAARVTFPPLTHATLDEAIREGQPVIAKVMLGERVPHWVLIVGKRGSEYLAIDPLNTDRETIRLSDRAARIHAVRVIRRA
jgi:hypothetical protein